MKDLEIIFVDDCSTDNSVNYIKEAQKIDPRIILLKNKKNMGTLYTKSKGILSAKGKYIYTLDSDDMIGIDDFLTVLYEEAEKGNYDFVECGYLHIDLKRKFMARVKYFKYHLWAKLIKRELYVNIINKIGNDVLNRGVVQEDDTFIIYFLYRGTKHKYVYKLGIFYFIHHKDQAWRTRFKNTTKFCSNYNRMVNALYDVGFNTTKGKFLSYRRLRDNIIHSVCIKIKSLREMNIKLLSKFKDSPYMDKKQLKIINDTLNNLQKNKLKDIEKEDIEEKENEEEIHKILEKDEKLSNNTIDDHLIS
jgi:glycosyltransferase involved in cell wall biosynthesis